LLPVTTLLLLFTFVDDDVVDFVMLCILININVINVALANVMAHYCGHNGSLAMA